MFRLGLLALVLVQSHLIGSQLNRVYSRAKGEIKAYIDYSSLLISAAACRCIRCLLLAISIRLSG